MGYKVGQVKLGYGPPSAPAACFVLALAAGADAQQFEQDHPGQYSLEAIATGSGILTTATDLLFTGGREGYFYALDARTGALLWKASLGGQIVNGPISYAVDGKQYVAVISGNSLLAFGLR